MQANLQYANDRLTLCFSSNELQKATTQIVPNALC